MGMPLPPRDTRARFWGLERWSGDNGSGKWERLTAFATDKHGGTAGRPVRWFPVDSYSESTIRAACPPGRFRVYWQPQSRKANWPPTDPFDLEPLQAPEPVPPPSPPTAPAQPQQLGPAAAGPSPLVSAGRAELSHLALVPPPIAHGQPGVSGDLVGGFERLHHLASSDASQITTAVAVLAQGFNQAVSQMAAVTIAMSGQRAQDAQAALAAIMAQQAQPNPQLAAIARQLEAQNAAIGQLAAAQIKTTEQLAELEEDDDAPPGALATIQEPTDGQRLMATLAPLAIEYGPKIAAKLWPEAPKVPGADGADGA